MAANPSGVTGAAYAAFGALLWLALVFLPAPAVMAVILLGAVFMIFDFKPQYFIMLIIASIPFETSRDLAGSFTVYTTEGILFAGAAAWGEERSGFLRGLGVDGGGPVGTGEGDSAAVPGHGRISAWEPGGVQ